MLAEREFFHVRRVRYQDVRPALVAIHSRGEDMFLTKSADWRYEREWRVLIPLEGCEVRGHDRHHEVPVHGVQLPRAAMTRVVLGCRATADTRKAVIEAAREITVYEAVPLRDSYALELRAIEK